MLTDGLQREITMLLARLNGFFEDVWERANRANFEVVYDDGIIHPENKDAKLVATLQWHDEASVGKLMMHYRTFDSNWGWKIVPLSAYDSVVVAASRSAAIRWAQQEINAREVAFIDAYALAVVPIASPACGAGEVILEVES